MSTDDINQSIKDITAKKERWKKGFRMAEGLIVALQIPDGEHLLHPLGYATEKDNKHAICRWVLSQSNKLKLDLDSKESYSILTRHLYSELSEVLRG